MLSRVADSIYWISRYIERTENVARFIDVNLHLMLDLVVDQNEQWEPLVITSGDEELFRERYDGPTRENVIQFLTFDRDNPNSIHSCVSQARENARSVRAIIPSEMWEQLNRYYLMVRAAASKPIKSARLHAFYEAVKNSSHLIEGITNSTLSHGEGWHFARLGRLIERADKTSRILDVKYFILLPKATDVGTPYDIRQWAAVLSSASALEMYRQNYSRISPNGVAEFLILNRQFPRAIHYCVTKGAESLRAILGTPAGSFQNNAEQKMGRLCSDLDYTRIDEIIHVGLHQFLDDFQLKLNEVGDAVHETFFALEPARLPAEQHPARGAAQREFMNDVLHSHQSG